MRGTVRIGAAVNEIQEGAPRRKVFLERFAFGLIPLPAFGIPCLAQQVIWLDAQHFMHRAENLGEISLCVLLPIPVG